MQMMGKPRIFVTRRLPDAIERVLADDYGATLNHSDVPLDRDTLRSAIRGNDILVPTITDRIDADLLADPRRRVGLIANFGAGVDHIDLAAASAAGVAVTNTPDALTEATAELAILLMLSAARRAGEGERQLRSGGWTGWRPTHLIGLGLHGRELGLVGFGRIAQATAAKARALGMRIRYFSRNKASPAIEKALDAVHIATLAELASSADVVSLHLPGGAETRHLVDKAFLTAMKPSAILVNTARGSVVDEAALADALVSGQIAGAALDVYEREPLVEPRLLTCENAVLLPHLGSATLGARTAMGMQAITNIRAYLAGSDLLNRVG